MKKNMFILRILSVSFLLIGLVGCTTVGDSYIDEDIDLDQHSILYLPERGHANAKNEYNYIERWSTLIVVSVDSKLNDDFWSDFAEGGIMLIPPGKHIIGLKWKTDGGLEANGVVFHDFLSGKIYFPIYERTGSFFYYGSGGNSGIKFDIVEFPETSQYTLGKINNAYEKYKQKRN